MLLDSRAVSRLHALIQKMENGEYCLIDLGSRNGSFVNGRRVGVPVTLRDGDQLGFGDQKLVFKGIPGPAPAGKPDSDPRNSPTDVLVSPASTTILVVDIRNFTPLAREVDESMLSQTIGTWFLRVGSIAQKRGSWAQKYIGDAVMSVWVHEERGTLRRDLLEVLRAAEEMARTTRELYYLFPLPRELRIGAGVNTGDAIIGHSDFTALGDTVNAAFRLESATKEIGMDVALGEPAFAGLSPNAAEHECFAPREVELKGYERPAWAWATTFEKLGGFLRVLGPG